MIEYRFRDAQGRALTHTFKYQSSAVAHAMAHVDVGDLVEPVQIETLRRGAWVPIGPLDELALSTRVQFELRSVESPQRRREIANAFRRAMLGSAVGEGGSHGPTDVDYVDIPVAQAAKAKRVLESLTDQFGPFEWAERVD